MDSDVQREQRRRGRPRATEADRLQVKTWYYKVKSRGQWTDYRLSKEFSDEKCSKGNAVTRRSRLFENLRTHWASPSLANNRRTSFDIISTVDAHPNFIGTSRTYRSQFWQLLKCPPQEVATAQNLVYGLFHELGLTRLENKLAYLWDKQLRSSAEKLDDYFCMTPVERYLGYLHSALREIEEDLDRLALLGALYREAFLCGAGILTILLGQRFITALDGFCSQPWLSAVGVELCEYARGRVIHCADSAQLNVALGWDDSATKATRLIVHTDMPAVKYIVDNEEALWDELLMEAIRNAQKILDSSTH